MSRKQVKQMFKNISIWTEPRSNPADHNVLYVTPEQEFPL